MSGGEQPRGAPYRTLAQLLNGGLAPLPQNLSDSAFHCLTTEMGRQHAERLSEIAIRRRECREEQAEITAQNARLHSQFLARYTTTWQVVKRLREECGYKDESA